MTRFRVAEQLVIAFVISNAFAKRAPSPENETRLKKRVFALIVTQTKRIEMFDDSKTLTEKLCQGKKLISKIGPNHTVKISSKEA